MGPRGREGPMRPRGVDGSARSLGFAGPKGFHGFDGSMRSLGFDGSISRGLVGSLGRRARIGPMGPRDLTDQGAPWAR